MKILFLMVASLAALVLSEPLLATTCQTFSYYNQQVRCPQAKDPVTLYTNSEISSVCSACGNTLQGVNRGNSLCCPQGYTAVYNSSTLNCNCMNPSQLMLQCIDCGYSPISTDTYCKSSNQISSAIFAGKSWYCPTIWGSPTQNVSGWMCSCDAAGMTPCIQCSDLRVASSAVVLSAGSLVILLSSFLI